VDDLELAGVAADEDHVRAMARACESHRTSDAAASPGYGDDTARELVGGGDMILQVERIQSVSIPLIKSTQSKFSGGGLTRGAPRLPAVGERMIPAR
jgi:hypothetical protein